MYETPLSAAVVTYVWGNHGRAWPSRDVEAVQEKYGDEALDLIPRLQTIFAFVDAVEVDWASTTLQDATDCIESLVRSAHPDLTDEAVRAIGIQFAYTWK